MKMSSPWSARFLEFLTGLRMGPKMIPKWFQVGSKMVPSWIQNGSLNCVWGETGTRRTWKIRLGGLGTRRTRKTCLGWHRDPKDWNDPLGVKHGSERRERRVARLTCTLGCEGTSRCAMSEIVWTHYRLLPFRNSYWKYSMPAQAWSLPARMAMD